MDPDLLVAELESEFRKLVSAAEQLDEQAVQTTNIRLNELVGHVGTVEASVWIGRLDLLLRIEELGRQIAAYDQIVQASMVCHTDLANRNLH